jgi:5-methylcytosine-specific restriction endonuclease McrA
MRRRWHDTKKNHKRRAAGEITISRQELVALRGSRCHICQRKIDVRLNGLHPMGLTIDHLLPVSRGGTNDVSNLDVAHRRCNIARGNRGYFQLGLESDAWAAS